MPGSAAWRGCGNGPGAETLCWAQRAICAAKVVILSHHTSFQLFPVENFAAILRRSSDAVTPRYWVQREACALRAIYPSFAQSTPANATHKRRLRNGICPARLHQTDQPY